MADSNKKYLVLISTLIRGEILREGVQFPSLEARKFGATLSDMEYLASVGHAEVIKPKAEIKFEEELKQAAIDGDTNLKAPKQFPARSFTAMQIKDTKYKKEQALLAEAEELKTKELEEQEPKEKEIEIEKIKEVKETIQKVIDKKKEEPKQVAKKPVVKKPKVAEKNKKNKKNKKSTTKKSKK